MLNGINSTVLRRSLGDDNDRADCRSGAGAKLTGVPVEAREGSLL
ncbi:MAG: hypothetical protein K0Q83_2914 [Deltaproteobacteria bacterium]|nr:hypothetical protein [Deltaproteobacteria bacterium]